jgi:opacity protein-like surface antigen
MTLLALALSLLSTLGPGETDLPRTLSTEVAPPPKEQFDVWLGGHLGIAGAYDADNPAFVIGFNARTQILPWLAGDFTLDFQTDQEVENSADISQIPFMFTALFYPPLDLPFRLYGQSGVGFTITNVDGPGGGADDTDGNLLFHLGFGAEFDLTDGIMLDANLRFVFAGDPPHSGDFSADWAQFTVGILFKLGR